ncbi:hypothetical protein [Rhizobium leguminosarum]|uniref:hypothetical protein n=1 Tax=Rhizobium leguminosarum TaxID=384 RepID=UPI001C90BCF8|nr:hypothetical protein [Rhizobium leguminosarum]MBY3003596.1 hypothetical protein [Rhizobium leguminosarum]MBY3026877.1 hypothetical protein [Rhizobium leguminosarum]
MDRDNKRTRVNESSSGGVGTAEERRNLLAGLRGGPLTDVAERLVTSNPRDTALDLGTFKSLAKEAEHAVRDAAPGESALTKFDKRNNHLGRSAIELANKLTDGLGFDSDAVALSKIREAGNLAHYLGPAKQAALVNRISNMEPMGQAIGVSLVSNNFSKFNDQNKSRIFELAIELAADHDQHHEVKGYAQNAILATYHHLGADQKARAHSLPDIGNLLQSMPPPRHVEEERTNNLDEHIRGIETSVRDTSNEQLRRAGEVGRSISHAYNHAREELMASSRSRDRAGSRDRSGR